MMSITIRTAMHDDADIIQSLTREAYTKWIAVIGREPLPMKVDYAKAVIQNRFDLLFVRDELAALIETKQEDGALLIVNLAVRPTHQSKGFGIQLLRLAETTAHQSGLKRVRLYTNKLFVANVQYYLANGYGVTHEEELNGGIAVHMAKTV